MGAHNGLAEDTNSGSVVCREDWRCLHSEKAAAAADVCGTDLSAALFTALSPPHCDSGGEPSLSLLRVRHQVPGVQIEAGGHLGFVSVCVRDYVYYVPSRTPCLRGRAITAIGNERDPDTTPDC